MNSVNNQAVKLKGFSAPDNKESIQNKPIINKVATIDAIQHKYDIKKNIEWAKPKGTSLTMDIYTPKTVKEKYPVLVIFHGGGWLINNNSIMQSMAEYIVKYSEYVVCNVNYRLLGDNNNTTTINEQIEDVLGAVLWIKYNIATYKGDSAKIAVTGDSAGGHLAACVFTFGNKLKSNGFSGNSLGFNPSWLPQGIIAEDIAINAKLKVQAAILNYSSFDIYENCSKGFETESNVFWNFAGKQPRGIFGNEINIKDNPEYYKAVSPIYNISQSTDYQYPAILCTVGSEDKLTTPVLVENYVNSLKKAGHKVEFWIYQGRPHAFLDSGKNDYFGLSFEKDAPEALNKMIQFLNNVFYN